MLMHAAMAGVADCSRIPSRFSTTDHQATVVTRVAYGSSSAADSQKHTGAQVSMHLSTGNVFLSCPN